MSVPLKVFTKVFSLPSLAVEGPRPVNTESLFCFFFELCLCLPKVLALKALRLGFSLIVI